MSRDGVHGFADSLNGAGRWLGRLKDSNPPCLSSTASIRNPTRSNSRFQHHSKNQQRGHSKEKPHCAGTLCGLSRDCSRRKSRSVCQHCRTHALWPIRAGLATLYFWADSFNGSISRQQCLTVRLFWNYFTLAEPFNGKNHVAIREQIAHVAHMPKSVTATVSEEAHRKLTKAAEIDRRSMRFVAGEAIERGLRLAFKRDTKQLRKGESV